MVVSVVGIVCRIVGVADVSVVNVVNGTVNHVLVGADEVVVVFVLRRVGSVVEVVICTVSLVGAI